MYYISLRKLLLSLGILLFVMSLSACLPDLGGFGSGGDGGDNQEGDCADICSGEEENDIHQGYAHWEDYRIDLASAVSVTVIDSSLMKLTTAGTLEPVVANQAGESYGRVHSAFRSHDDKIYLALTSGCTDDGSYCQCAIAEIDPALDTMACMYQPTQEYKWSIAASLRKLTDNSILAAIAKGDNSGEEILKIVDGSATVVYENSNGMLDVFFMDNGGAFINAVTDNMGHGKGIYLPVAGGVAVDISENSISGVMRFLNGPNDPFYYVVDAKGYNKFDPSTETLLTPVYMGKTHYSSPGYTNINYDVDGDYYQGYAETDTQFITPITLAAADVTSLTAEIVLTSDQHQAISAPSTPLLTIEVNDETAATENWMLTNWGLHKFNLPNIPSAVNLGLTGLTNIRDAVSINGQSIVVVGGSYNVPYYMKHYYADAGTGALSIDLLQGVLDGEINIDKVTYDQKQHYLLFYVTKIVGNTTEKYIGYSDFVVSDSATHSGGFNMGTKLIRLDDAARQQGEFVFLP